MDDFKVLTIGGGLGGLCLAQALRKEGIKVAVYERNPTPHLRNQGYRINLNREGLYAVQKCQPVQHN